MRRYPGLPLILLLVCSLFSAVSAQEKSRQLEDLSVRLGIEWQARRAEAESIAASLNLPIRRTLPDGRTMELQRFENGAPLYYITNNVISGKTISTDKVYPGGAGGYNLTGSGMILGEWDAGGVRATHQEFGGRVLNSEGTLHRHSTHVAGTMIAAGVQPSARGMSYQASLKAYDWNSDFSEMAAQAAAGLRVSNHSYGLITGWDYDYFNDNRWVWWGSPSVSQTEDYRFGFYDGEAQSWDQVAHAAPYLLIVKSAGNDRDQGPAGTVTHWVWNGGWTLVTLARNQDGNGGYDCLEGGSVSKDPIVVGAVGDISGGYSGPGSVVMSSFSSWGPTDDGRIKPDVVANGVGLYSTFETSNTAYGTYSGTSMATPSVAGSVGLLLQHEQNLHPGDSLLASTIKGLIIHTADEAGSNPGPDYRFGWGLMNTLKAVNLMTLDSADGPDSHIREMDVNTGDTLWIDFASTGAEPLRATICWNDIAVGTPPVSLDPPNLILWNDIDMRIFRKSDGAEFGPWILDPSNPADTATTGDNFRDNVEQILINDPGRTLYTMRITHKKPILLPPVQVSLIMSGNIDSLGPAMVAVPDTIAYSVIPGASFDDSVRVYNEGDAPLTASITKDPGSFWLSLTEDSVNLGSLDSSVIHYTVDGSLWSQWTTYDGSFTLTGNDTLASPLGIPVVVNVLGPTISRSPASYIIDLDSAEVGTDTLMVGNTGYIPLDVIVSDSAGPLPAWIVADPDTFTVPPGDSVAVVLTTNQGNEPLGDYYTILRLASNDSATGTVHVPVFLNIGTRTLFHVDVTSGWNMVSLPVEPITGLKSFLFPAATTDAYGFNGAYYQAETLVTGPGYWMKFASPASVIIDGYTAEADTIPVFTGWNMVGSISVPIPVSGVTTSPGGIITSAFYAYNAGYVSADSIIPGKAYWVQTDQDGDINMAVSPQAAPKSAPAVAVEKYNSISIRDRAGSTQTLLFAAGVAAPAGTALPPPPPGGGFDARFTDGKFFALFPPRGNGPASRPLRIASPSGEVTVTASLNARDGETYALVDEAGNRHDLADGASVTILPGESGTAELELISGTADIPTEYALEQNYPNPFNPSTTISFALPEEAMVTIRLYNILGNEVGTIAARRYGAGKQTVEFNAGELPSGVYIYTMRAGTFAKSRKLVLMR